MGDGWWLIYLISLLMIKISNCVVKWLMTHIISGHYCHDLCNQYSYDCSLVHDPDYWQWLLSFMMMLVGLLVMLLFIFFLLTLLNMSQKPPCGRRGDFTNYLSKTRSVSWLHWGASTEAWDRAAASLLSCPFYDLMIPQYLSWIYSCCDFMHIYYMHIKCTQHVIYIYINIYIY